MPADRLTPASPAPKPCTCHPSEAPSPCARRYALSECRAASPALPAMTAELVAALREWHATLGPRLEYQGGYDTERIRLQEAIETCPGLLAPPPATTDATFWLGEAA